MLIIGYWSVCGDQRERAAIAALRPRQLRTGRRWAIAVVAESHGPPGQNVRVTDGQTQTGWLVGHAFGRDYTPLGSNPEPLAYDSLRSSSRNLPWGDWVTAVADDGQLTIARSALSDRTLYVTEHSGGIAFASTMDLLVDVTRRDFEPDWDMIAGWLVTASFDESRSAFTGVKRVAPGQLVRFTRGDVRHLDRIWRPEDFANDAMSADPDEVREALLGCTRAWTEATTRPWVSLSGGLDSTAVLWATRRSASEVRAVHTHNTAHRAGDELERARRVCAHLGVPLEIVDVQSHLGFSFDQPAALSEPDTRLLGSPLTQAIAEVTGAAGTLFTGVGSDPVWCTSLGFPHHLEEISRRRGWRTWWRAVRSHSRHQGFPVLPLVAATVDARMAWFARRAAPRLLREREASIRFPNWLTIRGALEPTKTAWPSEVLRELPRGKAAQLVGIGDFHALVAAQHERLTEPVEIHPMLSQPLVELALRAPVSELLSATDDRIPLRLALRGKVPEDIRTNRRKGESSGTLVNHFRRSANELSDLVAGGRAVERGLVDRELALADAKAAGLGHADRIVPLLRLAAVEIWCENWDARRVERR